MELDPTHARMREEIAERYAHIAREGYADIARAGHIIVNGSPLTWNVTGDTAVDMPSFCDAFQRRMNRIFSSARLDERTLQEMIYWVCKGSSMTYVLMQVRGWLQNHLNDPFIQIMTYCTDADPNASKSRVIAEYFVEIEPGMEKVCIGMRWPWKGNVVSIPPDGDKVVRGTLADVSTAFNCPPEPGYNPIYKLHLSLPQSAKRGYLRALPRLPLSAKPTQKPKSFNMDALEPINDAKGTVMRLGLDGASVEMNVKEDGSTSEDDDAADRDQRWA